LCGYLSCGQHKRPYPPFFFLRFGSHRFGKRSGFFAVTCFLPRLKGAFPPSPSFSIRGFKPPPPLPPEAQPGSPGFFFSFGHEGESFLFFFFLFPPPERETFFFSEGKVGVDLFLTVFLSGSRKNFFFFFPPPFSDRAAPLLIGVCLGVFCSLSAALMDHRSYGDLQNPFLFFFLPPFFRHSHTDSSPRQKVNLFLSRSVRNTALSSPKQRASAFYRNTSPSPPLEFPFGMAEAGCPLFWF